MAACSENLRPRCARNAFAPAAADFVLPTICGIMRASDRSDPAQPWMLMSRGLDHIVHAVRDLDGTADFYRRLGFTVGARNRHPWGTHNYIVQFPGVFIELLTLAEPDKLGTDGFSRLFGAYTGAFLSHGEGLSLLILESRDAAADEATFRAAGIAAAGVMRFEREGKRPDGSVVKLAFSLAFATDDAAADIHFAVCQQHYPENFWNPAFQTHANGVENIAGIVAVADEPSRHRDFLQAFTGAPSACETGEGFTIDLPRGTIEIATPAAFVRRFGMPAPDTSRGARLAALRFTVSDAGSAAVVGPQTASGATLVFERPAHSAIR
jgi:catechol 2,3-dioxygenase-like lactoylglutathione lyase family enzyme